MKASTVSAHITQLTRAHFVNAFLVREEDGLTLVDTTMGRADEALLAAAASAGAPIRRIALTHGHGDHGTRVRSASGLKLDANHPELLLEGPHNLDQHVL